MNDIQIIEIELNDYRQYEGTEKIDLRVTDDENINVIQGQIGSGKSNLLNAITLCFYDKETHLDSTEDQGLDPLVNLNRLSELDTDETATGHIEIRLGRDEAKYIFKREFTTAKIDEDEHESETGDLQLHQRFGQDWQPVDQPNTRLKEILPTRVHEYFFFDGEKLDDFFDEGYTDRIQEAILDVSHIELLNRAISHLDNVQSDFEKESAEFEGETKRREEEFRDAKSKLEDLREEKSQLESEIEEAREAKKNIDSQLEDSRDEKVREKQSRRQYLTTHIDDLEDNLGKARAEAGQALTEAGILVYNEDALRFAQEKFDQMENEGELPPKIQRWFINELLEKDECICGEDLSESPEKRERLQELRERVPRVPGGTIEGKIEIPNILESSEERIEHLKKKKKEVEEIREEIRDAENELEEISAFLESKDIPDDIDVNKLESQRKELEKRINQMQDEKGQLKSRIERQEQKVDEKREKWEEEMNKKERRKVLLKKIDFVKEAKEQLIEIKSEILNQVREQTRENLEEYFNSLIWKQEHYDIDLTNEYEVNITNPSGEKGLGSLSSGERQVLALSFMSSLSQISGFSAPIVIDTPLGRISSEPKKRIAKNIPDYLEGKQVTFLMTDEEYTEEVSMFFGDSVAHEYHLDYQDEVTEVKPL
jgi:DNA sulfur modification protein DndD